MVSASSRLSARHSHAREADIASYRTRRSERSVSRESSPGAPWSVVLGLHAPWLDLEQISHTCLTERNAIPVLRAALEEFRQAVQDTAARRKDAAGNIDARELDRAVAHAMELHRAAVARIDAHDALQTQATWLSQIGGDWVLLPRGDTLIARGLQGLRERVDAQVDALRASGVAVDSPSFAQARAACLRLHEHGTSILEAHRTLGLRAPWSPVEMDLRCATAQGIAQMRQRCVEFRERVDQEEQAHRDRLGFLTLDLEMALQRCKSVCEDALAMLQCHEDEIRAARTSTARKIEEIAPPPPDATPPALTFDTVSAASMPMYQLDESTAQRIAEEAMQDLDALYRSGNKSSNKANLRKGFDTALERVRQAMDTGVERPEHATPRQLMEAARRMPWHNCTDLVHAGQGYLSRLDPPIATAHIEIDLPGRLAHRIGVLNAAHHLPLDKDMTRWPADVWVFDRWTGNKAVRARDYPQYFLDQMNKWHASEKLVRGEQRLIGQTGFFHWYSPMDTRWVEGIVNALRHLPQIPPPPADQLQPWPGSPAA